MLRTVSALGATDSGDTQRFELSFVSGRSSGITSTRNYSPTTPNLEEISAIAGGKAENLNVRPTVPWTLTNAKEVSSTSQPGIELVNLRRMNDP